jgi:hypothetical protein
MEDGETTTEAAHAKCGGALVAEPGSGLVPANRRSSLTAYVNADFGPDRAS